MLRSPSTKAHRAQILVGGPECDSGPGPFGSLGAYKFSALAQTLVFKSTGNRVGDCGSIGWLWCPVCGAKLQHLSCITNEVTSRLGINRRFRLFGRTSFSWVLEGGVMFHANQ